MLLSSLAFWLCDFEFGSSPGERPAPRCMVAREFRSGRTIRLWENELRSLKGAPFDVGLDSIFVAYNAVAEMGCFEVLGWEMPRRVLDLHVEFKNLTNGKERPCGHGLLGALVWYDLKGISVEEKQEMRSLALRGGPYSEEEKRALISYCESDVDALGHLLHRMSPEIDLPRALIRGRYTKAVAKMEAVGVPVDVELWSRLCEQWPGIKLDLIRRVDSAYGVFDGPVFKTDRFESYLEANCISWPRLPSGRCALDHDTFRDMAKAHPRFQPLRELRSSLSQLKLADLAVGRDGRNRTPLWPFGTKTGRNAPSTTEFIFGPAVWIRNLIVPPPGHALAYCDWSGQEYGIGAALSGDERMWEAYATDPYIRFAIDAGLAPKGASKATHPDIREICKAVALSVNYGAGAESIALRINRPPVLVRDLLRKHRELYPKFWAWSDAAIDRAYLYGEISTAFGWTYRPTRGGAGRTVRNFPAQGNGAEMLRFACSTATEDGVAIAAPVHDALLVIAPIENLEETIERTKAAMAEASRIVLGGFVIKVDVKIIRHPNRYSDPRGEVMWRTIRGCLGMGEDKGEGWGGLERVKGVG